MTGRRKSEICGLTWRDIDLEGRRVWFTVKGGQRQHTPLSGALVALVTALPRSNVIRERPYVFTTLHEDGERYRINATGGYTWKAWREAVEAAEIEDFRFHDLRHTFASRMLRQTGNLKLVSRLLGHSDVQITARYAHVLDDDLSVAMEAFSSASPETISRTIAKTPRK